MRRRKVTYPFVAGLMVVVGNIPPDHGAAQGPETYLDNIGSPAPCCNLLRYLLGPLSKGARSENHWTDSRLGEENVYEKADN